MSTNTLKNTSLNLILAAGTLLAGCQQQKPSIPAQITNGIKDGVCSIAVAESTTLNNEPLKSVDITCKNIAPTAHIDCIILHKKPNIIFEQADPNMQGTTQCIFTPAPDTTTQFWQIGYTKLNTAGYLSIDTSAVQIMNKNFFPEPRQICTTLTVGQNPNNNVKTCSPTTESKLRVSTAHTCQTTDPELAQLVEYCKLPPTQ